TPPLVTRSGPEVEAFEFTDRGACAAFLAAALKDLLRAEPLASVALPTPSRSLPEAYPQGPDKGQVPPPRRGASPGVRLAPGVEVSEIEQVKGLEFAYVVLVEVNAAEYPDTPTARRLLHVGATRAVHQLWLTTVGTSSPIVREALGQPIP